MNTQEFEAITEWRNKNIGWEAIRELRKEKFGVDKSAENTRSDYRRQRGKTEGGKYFNKNSELAEEVEGIPKKTVQLEISKEKVPIWFCSDIHYGDKWHLKWLFDMYLRWAEKIKPRMILGGDMFNAAVPNSTFPHAVFEQIMSPEEQLDGLVKIFTPFAEYIDGILDGNHENWIYKQTSLRPGRLLAQQLNISHLQNSGYLTYKVNGITYTGFVAHGNKSLRTDREFEDDIINFGHTDFRAYGHDHEIWHKRKAFWDEGNYKETVFVRGGSFHGYSKYARDKKMGNKPRGSAIIYLYSDQKIISPNTSNFVELGRG